MAGQWHCWPHSGAGGEDHDQATNSSASGAAVDGDRVGRRRPQTSKWISARNASGARPTALEPMVGTWVIAQDGPTRSSWSMDGRGSAARTIPPRLLIEGARKLYGTSNEELMDNAKQFAYYPVALLKGDRHASAAAPSRVKFKTVARRLRPLLGDRLQRQAERRLAGHSLQRHRTERRALGVPQRRPPAVARGEERQVAARPRRLARAEDDRQRRRFHGLCRRPAGARLHPRQRARAPAGVALPTKTCTPPTTPCCARRSRARVGLWSKTDSTSYFKDIVVTHGEDKP